MAAADDEIGACRHATADEHACLRRRGVTVTYRLRHLGPVTRAGWRAAIIRGGSTFAGDRSRARSTIDRPSMRRNVAAYAASRRHSRPRARSIGIPRARCAVCSAASSFAWSRGRSLQPTSRHAHASTWCHAYMAARTSCHVTITDAEGKEGETERQTDRQAGR